MSCPVAAEPVSWTSKTTTSKSPECQPPSTLTVAAKFADEDGVGLDGRGDDVGCSFGLGAGDVALGAEVGFGDRVRLRVSLEV